MQVHQLSTKHFPRARPHYIPPIGHRGSDKKIIVQDICIGRKREEAVGYIALHGNIIVESSVYLAGGLGFVPGTILKCSNISRRLRS